MAVIVKAPNPLQEGFSVFLAGSIEMGVAVNWQQRVEMALAETDIVIFNPRRDDWDTSWVQSMDNPQFREQVEWELAAQEKASVIAMYFDPSTKSPISLLELGLFARTGKMIVCCPDGFWRKGNVDIVCHQYGVQQADDLNALVDSVLSRCTRGK
jgi:hypothetical protein